MKNTKNTIYSLCGAVTLTLSASIEAEEVTSDESEAQDKVLIMESIHVTAPKEIAPSEESSGDPAVDQVLKLVDSLTDELTVTLDNETATNESTSKPKLKIRDSVDTRTKVAPIANSDQDKSDLTLIDALQKSKPTKN